MSSPATDRTSAQVIAHNEREARARAALENQFGRPLSDEEWTLYSARLLAYVRLLKSWEEASFSSRSSSGLG